MLLAETVTPIFPPRPKGKISPGELVKYSNDSKWVAQRKFNGTRNVTYIAEDRSVYVFSRHGSTHAQFKLTPNMAQQFKSLNLEDGKSYWLDSEVLNNKTVTPFYKGKIVLFDVLQAGNYLLNVRQSDRIKLLDHICNHPKEKEPNLGIALRVTEDIWMAETFENNFVEEFNRFINAPEIEGLLLRNKDSVLDNLGKKEYEISWMLRCRKPHKNYLF